MNLRDKLEGALKFPGIALSFSRLGSYLRRKEVSDEDVAHNLAGKNCLVTGANSGIGLATARALAVRNANVWLLCRDPHRGRQAADGLGNLGLGSVHVELVDMTDPLSIEALVGRLVERGLSRIDVLVHNAGALFDEETTTPFGVERTFALHVVGPEMLTRAVMAPLKRASGRVIYVSSGGMYSEKLSIDDLVTPPSPFDGVRAYALAKRAQVVLAESWARREREVSFYAMHPGWVDTGGVKTALPRFYALTKPILRDTEQGADTIVWLASAENTPAPNGSFVFDRRPVSRHLVAGTRQAPEDERRLWSVVSELSSCSSMP